MEMTSVINEGIYALDQTTSNNVQLFEQVRQEYPHNQSKMFRKNFAVLAFLAIFQGVTQTRACLFPHDYSDAKRQEAAQYA